MLQNYFSFTNKGLLSKFDTARNLFLPSLNKTTFPALEILYIKVKNKTKQIHPQKKISHPIFNFPLSQLRRKEKKRWAILNQTPTSEKRKTHTAGHSQNGIHPTSVTFPKTSRGSKSQHPRGTFPQTRDWR